MIADRKYLVGLAQACALGLIAAPLAAQETAAPAFEPFVFAGTVVAREITGLSYETGGCIVAVSDSARRTGVAQTGQVLVELDTQVSELALETARARVADLEAAVDEKQLAIDAAEANVERRAQELAFVGKEFTRNEQMFRRGLINESTMEGVESRMMNADFAADQARAEIALRIGELELQSQEVDYQNLKLRAPYDGVLLGFEPNVGDCVNAGASVAQIYAPEKKAVEVFVRVDQLVAQQSSGVTIGAPVRIARINGQSCGGAFTWIGTEADLEHQYVKSSIEVDEACAPALYLNEAVEVETLPNPS